MMDSGVGGISVLREMTALMPQEDFHYFGDSLHAPYGTRTTEDVRALVFDIVDKFLKDGAKAIAIACNTATSAAVASLRRAYPRLPLVGIEPAIKPASIEHPGENILVMATPMTIREDKFQKLLSKYKDNANIIPLSCPGLMEYVEAGSIDSSDVENFLRNLLEPYTDDRVQAVVLGCTHYPFVLPVIKRVLGEGVSVYDGGAGTARQLRRMLKAIGLLRTEADTMGRVTFSNSDPSPERIELCERLFRL